MTMRNKLSGRIKQYTVMSTKIIQTTIETFSLEKLSYKYLKRDVKKIRL